jgi:ABC-type multidrug transport system ATPase subunit
LITHRLAGLQKMDEVLVLDRGRVVERGTHAELLGRDGRYAALWRLEYRIGVVEAQSGLAAYFDEEEKLPAGELDAREDRWAEMNAREAVREEPW